MSNIAMIGTIRRVDLVREAARCEPAHAPAERLEKDARAGLVAGSRNGGQRARGGSKDIMYASIWHVLLASDVG